MYNVGDTIKIKSLCDPYASRYIGKQGVITSASRDPWGDFRIEGTWCGIAIYPYNGDEVEVIKHSESKKENK